MNQADQQTLFQAKGIVTLSERILDDWETVTKEEVESLQQSLSAVNNLILQVIERA